MTRSRTGQILFAPVQQVCYFDTSPQKWVKITFKSLFETECVSIVCNQAVRARENEEAR